MVPALDRITHRSEMQYFGVSSFLIRDGNNTLMIDGFVSRPKNALLRPIQPDITSIREILERSGIETKDKCKSTIPQKSRLDVLIVTEN